MGWYILWSVFALSLKNGFAGDKFTIKATTPPTIKGSEMFNYAGTGVKLDPKTLYVPTGCATAYSESKWAQFFENIIEM